MKRVGIFSGTFDPVHNGHLQFAHDALKAGSLDKIFFLVEPRPRRKQGVKAFEHRLRMVQLAVADETRFGTIVLEQARFTPHETLPILQARFVGAELHLLMGDDMLKYLGDWPHVDGLIRSSHFIIGVRRDADEAVRRIKTIEETRGLRFHYRIFQSSLSEASSSRARQALRRGESPDSVPAPVKRYIQKHGLYTSISE